MSLINGWVYLPFIFKKKIHPTRSFFCYSKQGGEVPSCLLLRGYQFISEGSGMTELGPGAGGPDGLTPYRGTDRYQLLRRVRRRAGGVGGEGRGAGGGGSVAVAPAAIIYFILRVIPQTHNFLFCPICIDINIAASFKKRYI